MLNGVRGWQRTQGNLGWYGWQAEGVMVLWGAYKVSDKVSIIGIALGMGRGPRAAFHGPFS